MSFGGTPQGRERLEDDGSSMETEKEREVKYYRTTKQARPVSDMPKFKRQ